jgi:hypothetical protein
MRHDVVNPRTLLMPRFFSFVVSGLAIALLAGCWHLSTGGTDVPGERGQVRAYGPLDSRADSLIARLLATPGSFSSDGNVYVFITDQKVLDELALLELHAVPQLIQCIGDDRPSEVTYADPGTGERKRALRGAVCFQALIETHFWQMHDDTLFRRVEQAVPCGSHETDRFGSCLGGRYTGYYAGALELHRTQRVWLAYLEAFRRTGRQSLPRLSRTAVGCYSLTLQPTHRGGIVIDSTRHLTFELDTLPLPGTVRPSTLRITSSLAVGEPAQWRAHYENRLLVSWGDRDHGAFLGLNFGGSDSALAGFQFYPSSADTLVIMGRPKVTRVPCAAGPSHR